MKRIACLLFILMALAACKSTDPSRRDLKSPCIGFNGDSEECVKRPLAGNHKLIHNIR